MPELPEVEALRRSLSRLLPGRRIQRVEVHDARLRERVSAAALEAATSGRRIVALGRRAKYLLAHLEGERTLVLHLGMSGRLTVAPRGAPRVPHEHVAFHLAGGERLRLVDPRRFGLALALPTARLAADPHFAGLGIEPLEGALDGSFLHAAARGRRTPVKAFLMDASVVVGVGNIYASEALFSAGIDPRRSVARIGAARWQRLAEAVRAVLERAIAVGGTTLNDFVDGAGNPGEFQLALAVYGREGEPCPVCAGPVRRLVQSGRSTYFCSRCQR